MSKKNKTLEPSIAEELRTNILARISPKEIWIFGSAATGTMNEISDIDVAIIFSSKLDLKNSRSLLYGRGLLLVDYSLDLLLFDEESFQKKSQMGGVCAEILAEGVKIHG